MGVTAFPVVSGAQVTANDVNRKMEPGTIMAVRTNTDHWSLVEYVQLDNDGVSQGEVLVTNFATLKQFSVQKAGTGDQGAPIRGIAAATITSQYFGFMYIGGYVEKADLSHTAASAEYLRVSGSTAGKLTPHLASAFNSGTQGNATAFMVVAEARTAIATGVGSITILGVWG